MDQQPKKPQQRWKPTKRTLISARKRTYAEANEPGNEREAPARPHIDVEAEKREARASAKRLPRTQGRITNPKTNQSNQYR